MLQPFFASKFIDKGHSALKDVLKTKISTLQNIIPFWFSFFHNKIYLMNFANSTFFHFHFLLAKSIATELEQAISVIGSAMLRMSFILFVQILQMLSPDMLSSIPLCCRSFSSIINSRWSIKSCFSSHFYGIIFKFIIVIQIPSYIHIHIIYPVITRITTEIPSLLK